jgi:hypothetical protein
VLCWPCQQCVDSDCGGAGVDCGAFDCGGCDCAGCDCGGCNC